MQRFRGGLVHKAHRLCVSLNSRLESNEEEEEEEPYLEKELGLEVLRRQRVRVLVRGLLVESLITFHEARGLPSII